jgi:hypothetical protein
MEARSVRNSSDMDLTKARFVYELHTIKSFLGHCLKSKARSDKDGKRLSQMHEDASRGE